MDVNILKELRVKNKDFRVKSTSNRDVFYQRNFSYPRIELPKELKRAFNPAPLPWAENVLNYYMSRLKFDGFANDLHGYTKLFYKSGAGEIIQEAIKDAIIDGVSFVFIAEDHNNYYNSNIFYRRSAEVSVYSENGEILYALLPNDDYDIVFDFEEGIAYVLKGDETLHAYEHNVKIVPIYPMGVMGDLKIGRKLLSDKFFALQRQASILNFLSMQGSLLSLNNRNLLIAQGMQATALDEYNEEVDSLDDKMIDSSRIPVIFSPTKGSDLSLEELASVELSDVFQQADRLARQAALSVGVPVKTLTETDKDEKNYSDIMSNVSENIGNSIEVIAKILMENYIGEIIESDYSLDPVFVKNASIEEIGQVGDALYKVSQILSANDVTSLAKRLLGISVKEEKMTIELPTRIEPVIQEEAVYTETTLSGDDFNERLKALSIGDNNEVVN